MSSTGPEHVCIIMDGNGRWAKSRMMPRTIGHKKGVETARVAIEFFARSGVKHLTLFAFSSENWHRPVDEVSTLMTLFLSSIQTHTNKLHEQGIRTRFIGDRSAFSTALQDEISTAEVLTGNNKAMNLNIAVNYGGQWDIVNATKKIAYRVTNGEISPENLDSILLASELSLADTPDPDLFIRTGGEYRISNFLIWQLAYTELFFSDVLWPDFSVDDMQSVLVEYAARQRRYGKTGDQVATSRTC